MTILLHLATGWQNLLSLFIALVLIFSEIVPLEDCYGRERLPAPQQAEPWLMVGAEKHSTPSRPDRLNFK